jgi:hypothetical protein
MTAQAASKGVAEQRIVFDDEETHASFVRGESACGLKTLYAADDRGAIGDERPANVAFIVR